MMRSFRVLKPQNPQNPESPLSVLRLVGKGRTQTCSDFGLTTWVIGRLDEKRGRNLRWEDGENGDTQYHLGRDSVTV